MDRTAAKFQLRRSRFEWNQYQKVVNETDKQTGKVYYRRAGHEIEMMAEVTDPQPPKSVLFSEGKVQLYQPKIDHLDIYSTGKNNQEFEGFLVLGFGGTSTEMRKSFDVTYGGHDNVNGIETDKLELAPKADRVKSMFSSIELWINSEGISVQQKLLSPEGDYRINRYSNIVLDQKIPDKVFKLKVTKNTQKETH